MPQSSLNATKLHAVAEFARFCVRNPTLLGDTLISQILNVAVRKLHDFGECQLGTGKFMGHPYWSRRARSLLRGNSGTVEGIKNKLAHEHVIPVQCVVRELLQLQRTSPTRDFERVLRRLSLVAIITREEDAALRKVKLRDAPDERWYLKDPWWRYREAKLLRSIVDASGSRILID